MHIDDGDFTTTFPAISSAGDQAAIVRDGAVEIYALPEARLIRTIRHSAAVSAIAFSHTGHDLVSGARDGTLIITRESGESTVLPSATGGIDAVAILVDGRVAAVDARSRLRFIDPTRNLVLAELTMPTRAMLLRQSPDGTRLVTVPSYIDATAATTGYYNDGTPCRISGTAPRNENTRRAALRKEAEHVAWLATQPPPRPDASDPSGEEGRNPASLITAPASTEPASSTLPPALAKPPTQTLAAFAPVYLASQRVSNAPSWVESKADILARYFVPRLGDLPLDRIDYAVIEDLKVALCETRNARIKCEVQMLAPKTVNNVLTVLGHVLETARRRGLVTSAPEICRVPVPLPVWDFLTFEESARLIAHAEGVWRTMIVVALRTGLRRGEILGLRWQDVDLATGRLRVTENFVRGAFKAPKSGKPREVPLSGDARAALTAHAAALGDTRGERVFCAGNGRPFTQGVMASQLERMCRRAGLRVIGWHVLRHSFASHLVMRGVPIRAVQDLMGHASIVITQRYAHLAPHVAHDAVRLLDGDPTPPAMVSEGTPSHGSAPEASAIQVPTPAPGPRVKTSREVRAERAAARAVARNRQETALSPLAA